ncbi:hypothetical protein AMATHDRAFT_5417 [Amanita thiersii Skay4041]|uniref:Cytochrome P450 n=1 Tax=Amanita thiersii Skay4041 TaxID=703135 RepID=A0A2A9NMD2_9AGAR|nr:hypothetical protein AMATHDRAFT_5417 [Amanita thiersii Skay4041]
MDGVTSVKILYTAAIASFVYVVYWALTTGKRAPNMPPGPPTLPIIGNMHLMPHNRLHFKFYEWAKEYGDAFSIKVMNQTIIVLNSPTLVREVFDKRAMSNSNRPKSIIANMIVPDGMNMGISRFADDTWKVFRKATNQLLSNEGMKRLAGYQEAEVSQLIWQFANQPDWLAHIKRFTTGFSLGIIYGVRGATLKSPNIADFQSVHPEFMRCLDFGKMPPIDLFPFLTWIPECFAQWKTLVKRIRYLHARLYDRLLKTVEDRLAAGRGNGCFMEEMIVKADMMGLKTRDHLLNLGAVILEGSDTTTANVHVLVLALAKFPEVLKRAQQEIDSIVGPERSPTFSDIPNLKYVNAIIEECNRFHPIAPTGLPHEMVHDEVISGMLFPKDTAVFMNLYFMYRDERYFDCPDEFIPERFLKNPLGVKEGVEDDPARRSNLQFGGGRRICPGMAVARTNIELITAKLIWGFNFLPAIDPITGKEIYPDFSDFTEGILAAPLCTSLRIVPRSAQHKEVIDREFSAAGEILMNYEREIDPVDQAFNSKYRDVL